MLVTSVLLFVPIGAAAFATTTVDGTNPAYLTLAVGETKIVTFKVVDASFNPISGLPVTIFYYTAYNYNGDPYFSVQALAPPTNANGTGIPAYLTDAAGQVQFAITGTQPAVGRVVQFLIPLAAFSNASLVVNVTSPLPSPSITSIAPTSGPVGTCVAINGLNFGSYQASSSFVRFGSINGSISSWTDTQINVKAPSAVSGVVPVTVATSGGTSNAKDFNYVSAQVSITSPAPLTNFFIGPEPQMPLINAAATISNVPNPACFIYTWTYNISRTFTVLDSNGSLISKLYILSNIGNPDVILGGQWTPNFGASFAGGSLTISVQVANVSTTQNTLSVYD